MSKKRKRYVVDIQKVHIQYIAIEALDEDDAREELLKAHWILMKKVDEIRSLISRLDWARKQKKVLGQT